VNRLSRYLIERFGERVYKVSLHGGFSCPNRDGSVGWGGCSFCSAPAWEPAGFDMSQTIATQLEEGMAYVAKRHRARRFIAYFQDYSATYRPAAQLARVYQPALDRPEVVGLALSTRPDCLGPDVLALLEDTGRQKPLWVELGLQIADDRALTALNRGHSVADFVAAVDDCHSRDIPVCAHVIVGLPGVSQECELDTARLLADLSVWGVKLHAFHVLRDTAMAGKYRRGGLRLLTLGEHVARVVAFLEQLPPTTVVHRVTAEAPRQLTLAPCWIANKMAAYDAVLAGFHERQTWQGRLWAPRSVGGHNSRPSRYNVLPSRRLESTSMVGSSER
jgi:radical SAM protein (TIGR01212 family)